MRAVLMTCLSACIGLVPAAISTGIGAQTQRPLATVIVGGMLLVPILILLILPVLISWLPDAPAVAPPAHVMASNGARTAP
jgi:heavy metal efflux system protein